MPFTNSKKAPAKINLLLDILGAREDGFHEIRSVMQTVSLFDTLEFETNPTSCLTFTCSDASLAGPDNLVSRAYQVFHEQTGYNSIGLHVHLTKHIPVAAGMGGGSSDCATMLAILNELHGNKLSKTQLAKIAAGLGSDVPFFLTGGTCLSSGRGEIIEPLAPLPEIAVALVKPASLKISAKEAYQLVKESGYQTAGNWDDWRSVLKAPDIKSLSALLKNDFENVLFQKYPDLQKAADLLKNCGLPGVLLSGSGPVIFGLMDDAGQQWPLVSEAFDPTDWWLAQTAFSPAQTLSVTA